MVNEKRQKKVLADFEKMKKYASDYYLRGDYEKSLRLLSYACGFMYTLNAKQYDQEIECLVHDIASTVVDQSVISSKDENIIFFDGYGQLSRGLTGIYINALSELGYCIEYITYEEFSDSINMLKAQLSEPINVHYVVGKTLVKRMQDLNRIVYEIGFQKAFINMKPDDVVATGVFSLFEGNLKRYLINMTDHAFWIGVKACDFVINFREFGYKACTALRNISENKLIYIPYYPQEIDQAFCGLRFINNNTRYILSGGALYKTDSKDKKFYHLISEALRRHSDLNFVYLGNGDARELRKLSGHFKGRVYFETERKDFFEIMKRCDFYVSTYPYNGGLMTQYALLAKKIPVTLTGSGIDKELTINDDNSFWNFEDFDECLDEMDRLLDDLNYRKEKEELLSDYLVDKNAFREELAYFVDCEHGKRAVEKKEIVYDGYISIPLDTYKGMRYCRLFYRKHGAFMLHLFTFNYLIGGVAMVIEKINLNQSKSFAG